MAIIVILVPEKRNLALGKAVIGTGVTNSPAVTDSFNSTYATMTSDTSWLVIDMENVESIDRVIVYVAEGTLSNISALLFV